MKKNNPYEIVINVETTFLPEHSNINENAYAFAYDVTISNRGTQPAQLISRHWIITEASGEVREVNGLGVIGEQPTIMPNESYRYTSSTVFSMPVGTMHGTYQMVAEDGTEFEATIPAFHCTMPRVLH
jgi:ApaG protein